MKRQIGGAAILAGAALLIPTTLFAQEIVTHPNSVKYKDSGIPNATGRSGAASIEARALLGRDGATVIDFASSGTIAKVQLKTGGITDNYNHVENGGALSIRTDGLIRHQPVEIQANVRDVDGARTDVVTASEIVKLRPDLAVTSISAPAQAAANVDVAIYAIVRELNGDTGARANAALLVNGTVVDRANEIWVDAGGSVSVAFRHAFGAYGNASLQVVVDSVDPGDWDEANNSASRPIEIAEHIDNWSAHALERTSSTEQTSHSSLWDTHTTEVSTDQIAEMNAWIQHPVNLNGFTLGSSASTDGRTLYDTPNVMFFDRLHRTPNGSFCTSGESWVPRVDVCYQPMANSQAPHGFVIFQISWHATDAVYHSWGYDYSVDPFDPFGKPRGVYDTTSVRHESTTTMGNTVQWDFRFTDGDGVVYHEQPFLSSLTPTEYHREDPYSCTDSRRYGTVCTTYKQDNFTREGSAIGAN
jgi:hypothetical protein